MKDRLDVILALGALLGAAALASCSTVPGRTASSVVTRPQVEVVEVTVDRPDWEPLSWIEVPELVRPPVSLPPLSRA